MDKDVVYGASGCLLATLLSLFLIKYNPNILILVLLPMWGLIFGIALGRAVGKK